MTVAIPACLSCRHFHRKDRTGNFCDAFPDKGGIPFPIFSGENPHTSPYPGDHGIRYSPRPGTEPPDGGEEAGAPEPNGRSYEKLVTLFRAAKALVTREAA